jgi:hypothetical protein
VRHTPAVDSLAGRNPGADNPAGRNREVGIRAGRNPAVGSLAGRNPGADTPAVDTRVANSRELAAAVDTPTAGMVVDQAIPAAVQVVRQVVSSPVNAPDVVGHQPILSIGGVFLNVPPLSVE